jgi:LysM repeat protein
MIAGGMEGWRNPARYLAPLAIAAVAVVSYTIIHRAVAPKHKAASLSIVQTTTASTRKTHKVSSKVKFYVVRPDDTLSKISSRTGVSVTTLEALNPNVNPQALHPKQRLRLRR